MKKNFKETNEMNRRQFLERLGLGSATALSLITVGSLQVIGSPRKAGKALDNDAPEQVKMTYRVQNGTGEKISLPEMNKRINELLKQSVKSDGVINLFSDVKTGFSLFDPKFLHAKFPICSPRFELSVHLILYFDV